MIDVATGIDTAPIAVQAGAPLPPFTLRGSGVDADFGSAGGIQATNAVLDWGALHLAADRLVGTQALDPATGRRVLRNFEATGNVVLTRGGQRIVGKRFVYDGVTAAFEADAATVVFPPLYIRGSSVTGTLLDPPSLIARDAFLAPHASGDAELTLAASEIRIDNGRAFLRNATIRLFGARVLTVPRLSFVVGSGSRATGGRFAIPLIIRTSRISGPTLGVDLPFRLARGVDAQAQVERTTLRGFQYSVRLGTELLPSSLRRAPARPAPPPVSALRTLVSPPPPPTTSFGSLDALTVPAAVPVLPLDGASVRAEIAFDGNREFGAHRFADLLVTREPEVRIAGRTPTYSWGRATLEVAHGHVRERRVGRTTALGTIVHDRDQARLGWTSPSFTLGDNGYARLAVIDTQSHYDDGNHYETREFRTTVGWTLGPRTGLELGVIGRGTRGTTPFFFDQVDTASEGLVRVQTGIGRATLGSALRIDLRQRKVFDAELVAAIRGKALEPRLRYTVLTRQWGVGFGVGF